MKTTQLKWSSDMEGTWLCALVEQEDAMFALENFEQGKVYNLELKKARNKKRSLDSNAYCWVLMDKLAEHYRVAVSEVYRNFVREIGGNSEIVCMVDSERAVDSFCKSWERNGLGWQTEVLPSKIEGCVNVKVYYGSSTYDTAQMSRLIEMVVQECKDAGIETLSERERSLLLEEWGRDK